MNKNKFDIKNKKFGRLTALEFVPHSPTKKAHWICECDCGNESIASYTDLTKGKTRSCGCLRQEATSKRRKTHGESDEMLYKRWLGMKNRCYNKRGSNYKYYGGRGIKVCDEWHNYKTFREWSLENGYKETLTIDRIDVNGDYSPNNCRWTDRATQARNTRNAVLVTINGVKKPLMDWCEYLDMDYQVAYDKLIRGGKNK